MNADKPEELKLLYADNCKKSIELCLAVEMLRVLAKRCLKIEALEQYDFLLKEIMIKENQLNAIWDEQIYITNLSENG